MRFLLSDCRNLVTLTPLRSCWYLVQSFKNKFRGSRYGVIACTIASSFILVINISLFLAALVFFDRSTGTGTLFVGNCDLVKNRNSALHLLINALSSILFCASSYTMQCLSSPTRQDVDNAHARQRSLDIGLLSMKNLFHIDGKKVVLWWILCLSSLPLHLLYVFFQSHRSSCKTFRIMAWLYRLLICLASGFF